jgi:hypothetical protein
MKSYLLGIMAALAVLCISVSAQNVSLTLVPITYPIQISDSGGSFDYLLFLTNNDTLPLVGTAWCKVTPAGGAIPDPALGPFPVTLTPGQTMGYYRAQSVPAAVPAGTYTFQACFGNYPNSVWDSSSFQFEKMGLGAIKDPVAAPFKIPQQVNLGPNYPNPFNPTTAISFDLPVASHVTLKVYNSTGRQIATLVEEWLPGGTHYATFNGAGLASGIYLAKLESGEFTAVQKMVLMK